MNSWLQRELKQSAPFTSAQQEVLLLLQMAAQRTSEPGARRLRQAGLTLNQYNVLRILRGAGEEGIACGEIGGRMITRDPDVTRLVDRLIRQGLATRSPAPGDRRVVRVAITAEGRTLLGSLDHDINRLPGEVLASLDSAQLEQLRELLEGLLQPFSGEKRI